MSWHKASLSTEFRILDIVSALSNATTCISANRNFTHVLHFYRNRRAIEWSVVAGKHLKTKPENGTQTRAVERIIVHSGYDMYTTANDIALVRLASPLVLNEHVQPVCLPTNHVTDGELGVVTGWGEVLGKSMLDEVEGTCIVLL